MFLEKILPSYRRKAEANALERTRQQAVDLIMASVVGLDLDGLDAETPEIKNLISEIAAGRADRTAQFVVAMSDFDLDPDWQQSYGSSVGRLFDPRQIISADADGVLCVKSNDGGGALSRTIYQPWRAAEIVLRRPLKDNLGRIAVDGVATHLFDTSDQEFAFFEEACLYPIRPEQLSDKIKAAENNQWEQETICNDWQRSGRRVENAVFLIKKLTGLAIDTSELLNKSQLIVSHSADGWSVTELS